MSHLLNQCETRNDVRRILHRGLSPLPELSELCTHLEQELPRPFLTAWHPLPDLGQTVLLRSLQGHTDWVRGCAVSPDGRFIVSASADQTLKVWDAQTGQERLTLSGHTDWVRGCAVSPDGRSIVSASYDRTLKVWDAQTGDCVDTLFVSAILFACTFCPDSVHIVAGGEFGIYSLRLLL